MLAPLIEAGIHYLMADEPDQVIQLHVAGESSDMVQGLDLFVQVADGGTEAVDLGLADLGIDGPDITALDVTTDTIFHANHDPLGIAIDPVTPQLWQGSIVTDNGDVHADGLIATITFDTSGFTAGDTFDLIIADVAGGLATTGFSGENGLPAKITTDLANGLLILNDRPVAVIGGPYSVAAGESIALDGSASYDPDTATDSIARYEWDLDNDGVFGETGANARQGDELGVMPTFSAAGLDVSQPWPIKLRVVDNHGFVSKPVAVASIEFENSPPTITSTSLDVALIPENSSVTLSGVFTEVDAGDMHTAEIAWGDGQVTIASLDQVAGTFTASHLYSDDNPTETPRDEYEIRVTLRDDAGGQDSSTLTVTVDNVAPVASAGEDRSVDRDTPITFAGTATDLGSEDTLAYSWDFGDGSPMTTGTLTPTHVYSEGGIYTVTLTVTDDDGGEDTSSLTVTVNSAELMASAGGDRSTEEGTPVTLTGTASPADPADTLFYSWDFGDGSQVVVGTLIPTHTYRDDGTYVATLTVADDAGGQVISTATITVANAIPSAVAGPDQSATEGTAITFAGTATDAGLADTLTYSWDFGDGTAPVDGTLTPTHAYREDGSYIATLTVTDDDGGQGVSTATVTVVNAAPVVDAGNEQSSAEGEMVTFSGSFSDVGSADTHTISWDFGDGTPEVVGTLTPVHVYIDDGTYTATLTVTDDDGGVDASTVGINVINQAPSLDSLQLPTESIDENGIATLTGTFSDPGTNDEHTVIIDWGDGVISDAVVDQPNGTFSAAHRYRDDVPSGTPGDTLTISATVSDGGASDSATTSIVVENRPPYINAPDRYETFTGVVFSPDGITFEDLGPDDTHTVTVDWGDGTPLETLLPEAVDSAAGTIDASHVYPQSGQFLATMTITDDDSGTHAVSFNVTAIGVSQVVGRYVFYNDSAFDGRDPRATPADDGAITFEKTPLMPGNRATTANYTNYVRGINGVMIDVDGLPANVTLDPEQDFAFKKGGNSAPRNWELAAGPNEITVRRGAGIDGSDRITLVWDDQAVVGQWLQVRLRATDNTGIPVEDVFYFGNAPGDTGNNRFDAMVTLVDESLTRANRAGLGESVSVSNPYDHNHDGVVNIADRMIARSHRTDLFTTLNLIAPPLLDPLDETTTDDEAEASISATMDWSWLADLPQQTPKSSMEEWEAEREARSTRAVDRLMANFRFSW